ncbi:MAG TPA: hypothetical protein VFW14_03625 [Gaiellales bacterium]|nr:hypothetical protein [Gaiellales bacterium]
MTLSVPEWNALMVAATSESARAIVPSAKAGHAIEKDLENALAAFVVVPGHRVVLRKNIPYLYPGWTPQPGALDLGIYDGDRVAVACELKLHDIDWGLYDLLKVVSLFRADKPATAAYLITGGTENEWRNSGLGAYFEAGTRKVGTIELLRANPKAMAELMYVYEDGHFESSGRPQTVASELVLEGFGPYGCEIGGVGELKLMSVRPAGDVVEVPAELRPTRPA